MIFDQPAELPVATLVPRDRRSRMRAGALAWLAAKWRWFKPRTVPMIVAVLGMLAVIGSANYLREFARRMPAERLVVKPAPPAVIVVDSRPVGSLTTTTIVGVPPSRCGIRVQHPQ